MPVHITPPVSTRQRNSGRRSPMSCSRRAITHSSTAPTKASQAETWKETPGLSGSLSEGACPFWSVKYVAPLGVVSLFIRWLQSFAKNAGLYGERVGALHVVSPTQETAARVTSQLSVLQRSEISNPPTYGARIVRGGFMCDVMWRNGPPGITDPQRSDIV